MLAEGVVAGGSVAGVMVTPPPLPHAPLDCCHRYDVRTHTPPLPPLVFFLIGLFFLFSSESLSRLCGGERVGVAAVPLCPTVPARVTA